MCLFFVLRGGCSGLRDDEARDSVANDQERECELEDEGSVSPRSLEEVVEYDSGASPSHLRFFGS